MVGCFRSAAHRLLSTDISGLQELIFSVDNRPLVLSKKERQALARAQKKGHVAPAKTTALPQLATSTNAQPQPTAQSSPSSQSLPNSMDNKSQKPAIDTSNEAKPKIKIVITKK